MQVAVSRAVTTCSVSRVCSRIPGGAAAARRNPTSICPAVSAMSCRRSFANGDADRRVGGPHPAPTSGRATRLRRAGPGSRPARHHHPGPTDSALGPASIPPPVAAGFMSPDRTASKLGRRWPASPWSATNRRYSILRLPSIPTWAQTGRPPQTRRRRSASRAGPVHKTRRARIQGCFTLPPDRSLPAGI